MKVIYFTNLRGNEGPGFVFEQIRLALEEAGMLYHHKYLPIKDPIEFDRKAAKEIKKCDVFIRSVGDAGGLFQVRKAKKLGITTIGTSFSTHTIYRERVFNEIYAKSGLDMRGYHIKRILNAERYTDYFLVLSEFSKYTFVLNGISPERVFVVPPGMDSETFTFAEPHEDPFRVLFVGTNPIRKGLLYLLNAWEELVAEGLKGELVVRSGVPRLSVKNVVSVPQWLSEDELVALYHHCSVTVLPSLEEGFAASNLESMACGRPIIATNVTGAEDAITDYKEGILIPSCDVKAIKEAILYFKDNPNELIRMGKNARHTAEQYTWERFRLRVAEIVGGLENK